MNEKIWASFLALKQYCEDEDFKGYDPYDGLNSRLFQKIPFISKNRIARLVWIQLFKRSPVNLRRIFQVKKDFNPKGLGLFLTGYCNLYQIEPDEQYLNKINFLVKKIISLESKGWSGSCWGYNFDWQARAFFQPKYTPTVVASTFVGYALLDAFDILRDRRLLTIARSVCDFILKDLNRTYDNNGNFAFSYSPLDTTQVFNATLLGARMLSRVYHYTGERYLIEEARKAISFCTNHQKGNGSWPYGTLPFHKWIDSFHTGYNLECIYEYQKYSADRSFECNIQNGLDFYLKSFFTNEGVPKYYNTKAYPIDIHSPAQLVVTLYRLDRFQEQKPLIDRVLNWTIDNMQSKSGYFYFQKLSHYTSSTPYIRWSQGWMFFCLSFYLKAISSSHENP